MNMTIRTVVPSTPYLDMPRFVVGYDGCFDRAFEAGLRTEVTMPQHFTECALHPELEAEERAEQLAYDVWVVAMKGEGDPTECTCPAWALPYVFTKGHTIWCRMEGKPTTAHA